MKKFSSLFLVLTLTVTLYGCGGGNSDPVPPENPTQADKKMELSTGDGSENTMEQRVD